MFIEFCLLLFFKYLNFSNSATSYCYVFVLLQFCNHTSSHSQVMLFYFYYFFKFLLCGHVIIPFIIVCLCVKQWNVGLILSYSLFIPSLTPGILYVKQNGKLLRSLKSHTVAVVCLNWEEDGHLIRVCFHLSICIPCTFLILMDKLDSWNEYHF